MNKLIKENYITSHDDELAFYDAFFNTLLEKGFSMNDINMKEKKLVFKSLILNYLIKEIEKIEKEEGKISN